MKNDNKQLLKENKKLQELLLEAQAQLLVKDKIILQKESVLLQKDKLILQKNAQIEAFIEQARLARAKRFAPSSEKHNPQQGELFDEAEQIILNEPEGNSMKLLGQFWFGPRDVLLAHRRHTHQSSVDLKVASIVAVADSLPPACRAHIR